MKNSLKILLAAATIGGAAMIASAPARADSFSLSINTGAVGFSYQSGGYCDDWGCPDEFWNYPIYYCPVYYRGHWYSGPVYYRYSRGFYWYWIHGDWRRDAWYDRRPSWACEDRYGPPLDLDFYIFNGFYIRDSWRHSWRKHRNDWWRHRHDWDDSREGHRHHDDWHGWVPDKQRNYDWNRQNDWNKDRDWSKPDWKNIYRRTDENRVINPPVINPDRGKKNPVLPPSNFPPVNNNPPPPKHFDRGNRNPVVTPQPKINPPPPTHVDRGKGNPVVTRSPKVTPPVDKSDRGNRSDHSGRDNNKGTDRHPHSG